MLPLGVVVQRSITKHSGQVEEILGADEAMRQKTFRLIFTVTSQLRHFHSEC